MNNFFTTSSNVPVKRNTEAIVKSRCEELDDRRQKATRLFLRLIIDNYDRRRAILEFRANEIKANRAKRYPRNENSDRGRRTSETRNRLSFNRPVIVGSSCLLLAPEFRFFHFLLPHERPPCSNSSLQRRSSIQILANTDSGIKNSK